MATSPFRRGRAPWKTLRDTAYVKLAYIILYYIVDYCIVLCYITLYLLYCEDVNYDDTGDGGESSLLSTTAQATLVTKQPYGHIPQSLALKGIWIY